MTTVTPPPTPTSRRWRAEFKKAVSEIDVGTNEDVAWIIEYSVVRESYQLGFDSWGWDSDDKLILFRCAYDVDKDLWRSNVCMDVAEMLNEKEL